MAGIFPVIVKKRPLVTAVHDLIPFFVHGYDSVLKYAIKRWCIKFSCRRSDYLIVPFSSTKEKIVELFGVAKEKIFVIPYGVNHQTYYPDVSVKKIKHRIAFLGEVKRAKGIDSIIKAFKYILEKVPDATLSLASNGYELEEMKQLAAESLPVASYKFEGFITEEKMNEFYNSADLFIFPSRYGFGLSALEAMACGTPTLVGDTLDAKDFFTDKDMLVNPDNEKQIAEKLIYLLLDENIKRQKSEQALQIAKQFSWEEMSKRYYEVCLNAINSQVNLK